MRPIAALALLALLSAPIGARAESDTHYQDTLLGARAAGMGGASIALGGEATSSFYNPAGIVVDKATLIQVSMSAYRWRRKKTTVLDVCGTSVDEDEGGLFGFPASVGFVKLFGEKVRHAVGLSLVVPFMAKRSQAFLVDDAQCGQSTLDLGGSSWLIDRVFLGSLNYAVRPLKWLRIGASVGVAVRDLSVSGLSNVAIRRGSDPDSGVNVSYTELDVTYWQLFAQLGAIVEPLPGLRFGLSITTPYVRLSGRGRYDNLEASRSIGNTELGQSQVLTLDDAEFYWKVPMKLGFGASYERPGLFTVAADVKLHLPVDRYFGVEHPQVPKVDGLTIERELVVNVNIGAEVWVWPKKLALRAGFFTNFASQPEPSDQGLINEEEESIDLFGGSIGGAYRTNDASLVTFAVQVMYGTGKTARFRIRPNPQTLIEGVYEIGETKDLSVLLSIGGAVDLD